MSRIQHDSFRSKVMSADEAASFINGVLGSIAREGKKDESNA